MKKIYFVLLALVCVVSVQNRARADYFSCSPDDHYCHRYQVDAEDDIVDDSFCGPDTVAYATDGTCHEYGACGFDRGHVDADRCVPPTSTPSPAPSQRPASN